MNKFKGNREDTRYRLRNSPKIDIEYNNKNIIADVYDVSNNGLMIRANAYFEIKDIINIYLQNYNGNIIGLKGIIKHKHFNNYYGVEIIDNNNYNLVALLRN